MIWPPPKETVVNIILYKNTKAVVSSADGDSDFFNVIVGVLLGDTLAQFLFKFCLRTSLNLIKEHSFTFKKKAGNRRYFRVTITDADYADDLALPTSRLPTPLAEISHNRHLCKLFQGNYHGHRLRRWSSASHKSTSDSLGWNKPQ